MKNKKYINISSELKTDKEIENEFKLVELKGLISFAAMPERIKKRKKGNNYEDKPC